MVLTTRRIKLSKNLKPFVSRIVRYGAVQIAFAEQVGSPVGQCVKAKLEHKTGLTGTQVHDVVRQCVKDAKVVGKKLNIESVVQNLKEKRKALIAKRAGMA